MADRLNLQQFVLRLNLIVTGIVFFLLMPTVHVYQWWFPDKKDSLWIYPAVVLGISALLWFLTSLSIPSLIKMGWVKDLRKTPRPEPDTQLKRILRVALPMLMTTVHLGLILFCAVSLIIFLRHEPFKKLLTNLP